MEKIVELANKNNINPALAQIGLIVKKRNRWQ
jgi:hypothetical protein